MELQVFNSTEFGSVRTATANHSLWARMWLRSLDTAIPARGNRHSGQRCLRKKERRHLSSENEHPGNGL